MNFTISDPVLQICSFIARLGLTGFTAAHGREQPISAYGWAREMAREKHVRVTYCAHACEPDDDSRIPCPFSITVTI